MRFAPLTRWYWIVAGSASQVYSSAAVAYVPISDATYLAWLAAGNTPTAIASEQDLWDTLALAGINIPASAHVSDEANDGRISQLDIVSFKVLFNHENRIRVLESKQPITVAQFKAGIRALL